MMQKYRYKHKRSLIVLFFIIAPLIMWSQQFADKSRYLVDSLDISNISKNDSILLDTCLTEYHQISNDTDRINIINKIIEESWDDNIWPIYNRYLLKKAETYLSENNKKSPYYVKYKKVYAGALNNVGYYHRTHGEIDKAIEFYKKAIKIREEEGFMQDLAVSYNNLGVIYYKQGNIYNAIDNYDKALKIQEEIEDWKYIVSTLNNLGALHKQQENYALAIEYYNRILALSEKTGNKNGVALAYNNIGAVYSKQNLTDKALEYYEKSLAMRKELGNKRQIALSLSNVGSMYMRKGDTERAIENYEESYKLYKDQNDIAGISHYHANMSTILLEEGHVQEAKKHALKGYELGKKVGFMDQLTKSCSVLYQIYKKEGNTDKALEMYEQYVLYRDSTSNIDTKKATLRNQAKYEYEKQKAIDDANHAADMALEQREKEKQQLVIYFAAAGIILLIIFVFFVINRLRVTAKQRNLIHEQKLQVEEINEELNQTNEELEAQRDQIEVQKNIIEEKHILLQDSIHYAKKIQKALLPKEEHVTQNLPEHFIFFKPKDIVSGDFYWADIKENCLYVAAVDCTGHGVPGAFMSIQEV